MIREQDGHMERLQFHLPFDKKAQAIIKCTPCVWFPIGVSQKIISLKEVDLEKLL